MKLLSLKLERFGHFQGATLDFPEGLQLLHGRNEAGKSTLVAAVRALLFQYPRGQYDFRFPESTLAVSARAQFADGTIAEVRREKGKGWKGLYGDDKFSDEEFREKLGRPSEELFKNVFAFGLHELARGGESIQEAGLGAALSGAAVGVGIGPDALAAELKRQAEELYRERGKIQPINQLVAEIRKQQQHLRESELRGDKFRALEEALAEEKAKAGSLKSERELLLRKAGLVESALRALPAKENLAGARLARERLGQVAALPASAEGDFREQKSDRDRLAARLRELEAKTARARADLENLGSDTPAAPLDSRLGPLIDSWSGHRERKEQLDEARSLQQRLTEEAVKLRARLDPPWTQGSQPPLPVPRVEEVRRHKTLLDGLSRTKEAAARDRERAARELGEAREQAERKAGEAPSPEELARLREKRDALWERIKKSWLEGALTGGEGSGELFRHATERQLAGELGGAMSAADRHADEMRRRAADVAAAAEAVSRKDERERALALAEKELRDCAAAVKESERAWQALWERCDFLPHSPDAMLEWLADYHALVETQQQLQAAAERCARLEASTHEYEAAFRAALTDEAPVEALYAEARRRLSAETEREQQRIRNAERRRHLLTTLDELSAETRETQATLSAREAELAVWRTRAQAADDEAFLQQAAAAREAHELDRELARAERTLAEARAVAGDELDQALSKGRELLSAERAEVAETRARLESELQETDRRVGAAEAALKPFDGRTTAIEQLALLEAKRAELRDKASEWARLTAARALLERELSRFSAQQQPRLLEAISKLFSAMTRGRYARVQQRLDDKRSFVAVRADGVEVAPEALSTGTREQLYLAVRLAYIDSYCARSEPLPLVLDDVLVNFDDERAAATLDVLTHFAAEGRTQVLFLTCHAHLVQLASRLSLSAVDLPPAG